MLESISQIDGQIVIKLFGEDIDVLRRLAGELLRTVAPVRGVARAFVDRAGQVPQLQIEIDRARAARYGLNVADVEDVIETALGGKTATELWEGERRFSVVVRLSEEERVDEAAIGHVLVDTPIEPLRRGPRDPRRAVDDTVDDVLVDPVRGAGDRTGRTRGDHAGVQVVEVVLVDEQCVACIRDP